MDKLLYALLYAVCWILSLIPLRMMYWISDALFVPVYHLVRYRRGVVRSNLASSFPEKSAEERHRIEKQFYHFFCDYIFETIKLLSISEKTLRKHFHTANPELVAPYFAQGRSVGAMLGHYANWEWLTCVGIDLPSDVVMGLIYHPLHNKVFDRLMRRIRSHGVTIAKNDILRYLLRYRREGILSGFGYIADQSPKWENIHLWLPFLEHETPVFTGAEKIMCKMEQAAFYLELSRPRRGQYVVTYHLLADNVHELPEFELTRRFFAKLEETVRREPAYYLWTHNRWKRTREEFERRFHVVDGRVLPKSE